MANSRIIIRSFWSTRLIRLISLVDDDDDDDDDEDDDDDNTEVFDLEGVPLALTPAPGGVAIAVASLLVELYEAANMSMKGSLDFTSGSGRHMTDAPFGSDGGYVRGPWPLDDDDGGATALMFTAIPSQAAPTVACSGSSKSLTSASTSRRYP